jgi:hypothetical protein
MPSSLTVQSVARFGQSAASPSQNLSRGSVMLEVARPETKS